VYQITDMNQNILALQKKKSRLAKFSLDGNIDNDADGRLEVSSLFVFTLCHDPKSYW
jgi:hypothetical protein